GDLLAAGAGTGVSGRACRAGGAGGTGGAGRAGRTRRAVVAGARGGEQQGERKDGTMEFTHRRVSFGRLEARDSSRDAWRGVAVCATIPGQSWCVGSGSGERDDRAEVQRVAGVPRRPRRERAAVERPARLEHNPLAELARGVDDERVARLVVD